MHLGLSHADTGLATYGPGVLVIEGAHRRSPRRRTSRRSLTRQDSELPQISDRPAAPKTVERRRAALGLLLVLSFLAVARLAEPVWIGIVFGAFMAFTTQPLYRKLCIRLGQRRTWAALLTTLATGGVCVICGALAVYLLTRELFGVVAALQGKLESGSLGAVIGEKGLGLVKRLGTDEAELTRRIHGELGKATQYIANAAGLLVETTKTAVLGLVIGCITMYYVLIEWPSIPVRLERVLPLDPRHTRALVLEFRDVGRSALIGTMVTALIQGILATIGYSLCSLPHAVMWGLLTAVASFLPVVGTAIIWVPVSLHFVTTGEIAFAVIEAAWGLFLIVGIGEYVVRPRLVGKRGKGQPLLMLVAALGGIHLFGLAGIVVGPVLMSLFLAILRIYEREMEGGDDFVEATPAPDAPLLRTAADSADEPPPDADDSDR